MLVSNEITESPISEKDKELPDEQNKEFAAKIEPEYDAYLCDEKHSFMMKVFLVSDIHHQAKDIIRCMLKKRNYINLNV